MNAPLMFSFKRSLVTRLFAIVMVVTFVAPNILAVAIPVARAEGEVVAESSESSDASDVSSNETEAADTASDSQEESNSTNVEAVVVSNETVADSTDTVITSTEVGNPVSPVETVANTDVLADTKDLTTNTDATIDVPAGDGTTSGDTTPTDTTPTDDRADTTPEAASAAELRTVQTGSITVCNVIAKANGTIVTSPAGLPEAAFSLNLRERIGDSSPIQTSAPIQETNFYSNLFTQTNPSPIPLSAQCIKYNNLPLKQYIYSPVTVTSQIHDRWETPKYNDQFINAVNSSADFYSYSTEMFDNDTTNDGQRNENADGIVTITAQRPHRVLVIFNKLKPVTPATSGTIIVCKIIQDDQNRLVTMGGSQLPPATFSLSFYGGTSPSPIYRTATWDSNSYMTTWPSPGADPSSTASALDADCQTFTNLPFDPEGYIYEEEEITGTGANYYVVPRYNDGATLPPSRFSNFFHYGPGIYGDDQIPGLSNNPNSDGRIMLTPENSVAKIFVLNQHNTYTPVPTGSIEVCKIIQRPDGTIATSSQGLPLGKFGVTIAQTTNFASTSRGVAEFDARNFVPNRKVLSTTENDAQCVTISGLSLETPSYYYSEERITNAVGFAWETPRYNDEYTEQVMTPSDFYPYTLESGNYNADGHIVLSPQRPNRTVLILNKYRQDATPRCANGTTIAPHEFIENRDLGFIRYELGPLGPTADADHIIIHASSTFAKFHITNDTGCTIPLGMGSYRVFSQHEDQEVYDIVEQVFATSSTDIYVDVPNCMAQIDVFYGRADRVLQPYGPNGENPYIYPGARGNFIFTAGFYFPNHQTWGDLPNSYCPHGPVNHPPVLNLLGDNPMNVYINTTFTDPGATATDQEDGDLTSQIVTTGSVDTSTLGSYSINYVVTDSGGLTASGNRKVNVIENPGGGDDNNNNGGGGSRRNGQRKSGGQGGEILGAQIEPTSCFYLRDYLRRDLNNDKSEVLKLQYFLKYFENESNLEATGTFDQATYDAVSRFQNKYLNDILSPWGHTAPTGYVYILTKKKVNEIFCNTQFPINAAQQDEIDAFRALLNSQGINGPGMMDDGSMMKEEDINNMVGVGETDSISSIGSNMDKMIKDKIDTKNLRAVAAAIFSVPNDRETILQSIYFLLIAIIAIYLFTEIIVGSRDSSKLTKYQVWSRKATGYIVGLIIAIVAAIWYQIFSIVVPLIALAIVSVVFLIWTMTKDSKNDVINLPSSKN